MKAGVAMTVAAGFAAVLTVAVAVAVAPVAPVFAAEKNQKYRGKILCPRGGCDEAAVLRAGARVITREPGYLVVALDSPQKSVGGYPMTRVKESDYVRRVVRVAIGGREDAQTLNAMGMDIFEVGEDYVLGQGMDFLLDDIARAGFAFAPVPQP